MCKSCVIKNTQNTLLVSAYVPPPPLSTNRGVINRSTDHVTTLLATYFNKLACTFSDVHVYIFKDKNSFYNLDDDFLGGQGITDKKLEADPEVEIF